MQDQASYTLAELGKLSSTNLRTVRDYVARALLEGTRERGPGARYPEQDLHRIRFIKRLREEVGLPLGQIGELLTQLASDEIRRIGSGEESVVALPLWGLPIEEVSQSNLLNIEKKHRFMNPKHNKHKTAQLEELKAHSLREIARVIASALSGLTGEPYEVSIESLTFDRPGRDKGAQIRVLVSKIPDQSTLFKAS